MSLILIDYPLDEQLGNAVEPITLSEACDHLRINEGDDDVKVEALITAARQYFDAYDGILGKCLISQKWQQTFDAFPYRNGEIKLKLAPVQSIESITYIDENGETQTLDSDLYTLIDNAVYLEYGEEYPTTRFQKDAIKVDFIAGYGDNSTDIPQPLKQAMLMLVAHWYDNRSNIAFASAANIPFTVNALVAPYREANL